jgi:hypothetical protein
MPENKTIPTGASVTAFLKKVKDKKVQQDCFTILEMMKKISKMEPVMWGSAIVGFGSYHYVYDSGREGDMVLMGFSPRKQNITIYPMCGLNFLEEDLKTLGKHKTGGGCLYIKSLDDVNLPNLRKLLAKAFREAKRKKSQTE